MHVIQNIIDNYKLLQIEFVGISLHLGFFLFFVHCIFAFCIFTIFYFLGDKIQKRFFNENTKFPFFVKIALGYIVISIGIGYLGIFSLLQKNILYIYFFIIILITFYPFDIIQRFNHIRFLKRIRQLSRYKNNYIVLGVFFFVALTFLRLSIPEIEEDTYHTDLPILYLSVQTTLHEATEHLHVIPYPQLPEMTYIIPVFFGDKDTARFIHYGFYLLIICLLFTFANKKENTFAKYAPLLFVTAPVVMRYSHAQYTDFFMVFTFLLAILLIEKKMLKKNIILSGILYGAAISAKVWTLVYAPAILLYIILLNRDQKKIRLLRSIILFIIAFFAVVMLWYLRAYIITGNPLYPLFAGTSRSNYFGFNWKMFTLSNIGVLSPLFFLGIILLVINVKKWHKIFHRSSLVLFVILLFIEQLVVKVDLGRYLLAWFTFSSIIVSGGIAMFIDRYRLLKYTVFGMYGTLFCYYFFTTLLTLPYAFGWADQNNFLSRIMERNNASYYDFNHLFSKWITKDDIVAIYGLSYYYYVDFSYIDANYIFNENKKSFRLLRQKHITKLFLKDTDIEGFCKKLLLTDCNAKNFKLLVHYRPTDTKEYNLYLLKK